MNRFLSSSLTCAAVLAAPVAAAAIPANVSVIQHTGPSENRIDLVIVGDGYLDVDQALMRHHAQKLTNYLLSTEPWASYAGLFNVKLIEVASNERGADHGFNGGLVDTAFDSYFNCYGIDRLLCFSNAKVSAAVAEHTPEYDYAVVMVNDEKYGGSGGAIAAVSIHTSASEILVHEIGHQVAGLADEYETPYPIYPLCNVQTDCPEPNATLRSTLAELKWAVWVEPGTPIPTPPSYLGLGAYGVGAYEGARYFHEGIYRPHENCKMRYLGHEFCPVCKEAHVLSFLGDVSLIENPTPPMADTGNCNDLLVFKVETPVDPASMTYTWVMGDRVYPGYGAEVSVPRWMLPAPGANVIQVYAEHKTDLVRNDPDGHLVDSWQFTAAGAVCPR